MTPRGLQYTPTGFSNLLKDTILKQLHIELPCYGVNACRHAIVHEERQTVLNILSFQAQSGLLPVCEILFQQIELEIGSHLLIATSIAL
jgi:hypothetical protein